MSKNDNVVELASRNRGKTKPLVIGLFSLSGGVGKSILVKNMAALLAGPEEPFGFDVVVFDVNAGAGDQEIISGQEPNSNKPAFSDKQFEAISFEEYVTTQQVLGARDGYPDITWELISGRIGNYEDVSNEIKTREHMAEVVRQYAQERNPDIVIVDGITGGSDQSLHFAQYGDIVIIPMPPHVKNFVKETVLSKVLSINDPAQVKAIMPMAVDSDISVEFGEKQPEEVAQIINEAEASSGRNNKVIALIDTYLPHVPLAADWSERGLLLTQDPETEEGLSFEELLAKTTDPSQPLDKEQRKLLAKKWRARHKQIIWKHHLMRNY